MGLGSGPGFRLGLGQPAVNFPPLTAKFLYEHFTEHIKDDKITVYDPSSGWGGRILGAMASKKRIHYIGTDPTTDNYIDEIDIKVNKDNVKSVMRSLYMEAAEL